MYVGMCIYIYIYTHYHFSNLRFTIHDIVIVCLNHAVACLFQVHVRNVGC